MADPKTVRVKCEITADNEKGFYVINEDDFDASKHEVYDGSIPEHQPTPTVVVDTTAAEAQAQENLQGAPIKPAWQS